MKVATRHRRQQQISVNLRSPTITSGPPRIIGPRRAIHRNTNFLQYSTNSERNVGINKRDWSKGINIEDNTTKTPCNLEVGDNVATSYPLEKTVSFPQIDS